MIKELVVNELSSLLFNNDNIKDTREKINNNSSSLKLFRIANLKKQHLKKN